MRRWQETQSPQLELVRHFCGQFFESELVSRPGQLKLLFTGVLSVLASLSIPFLQAYYHKYLGLKQIASTEPFRLAVMADSLFLISLNMVATGVLTALFWQSLFPDRRDYLALAGLPLRMQEVFRAKFLSLLGLVTLAALFLAVPMSVGVPAMMQPQAHTPHFAAFGLMEDHLLGLVIGSLAGSLFVFFVLVAFQGLLINLLPLRVSGQASFTVQAGLLVTFLAAIPAVIAIPRWTYSMSLRPDWAAWVPPLWFLGVEQRVLGNPDPLAARLAWQAWVGLGGSMVAAVAAYWWSYRRHRVRVLESAGVARQGERWSPEPRLSARALGVFAFTLKTLIRSPQHRLILTAFAGVAIAVSVNGVAGSFLAGMRIPRLTVLAAAQLAPSLCTISGLHYLFRLPVEPRACWVFRLYEPGHTRELLSGREWFMLWVGIFPVTVLSLVANTWLVGIPGLVATALAVPPAMILVEILLLPTYKLPFTSLYLPAQKIIAETLIKYGVVVVLYVSVLSTLVSWCADSAWRWLSYLGVTLAAYGRLRKLRLEVQSVGRVEFEELPDVVVQTLSIDRD